MTFRDAPQETETPAPGPFGVPPEYFGPPDGETALRADEMHANRIETEAMGALRIALHDPQTGFASRPPTERLAALPELQATLDGIGETFRAQATTPRQQAILGPLLDNHLEHAATQVGRLAEQALAEADDGIVETRIGGLQRDAAVNWDDPARLRILGRAIVTERRAQGERKSWDKDQTETRVRHNVSDFYATAIEAATDRDLDRAGKLLADAQGVLLPDRQSILARKLAEARDDKHVAGIAGTLAAIPLDPASAPLPETYRARAEELTPDDASSELRARIAQLADTAQRHATKYWQHDRNQAGLAAIDWMVANPGAPVVTMDRKVAAQLSPEQLARLLEIETAGRLDTDPAVYDRLDRLAVYKPKVFAVIDLSQYRLALDGRDYARFNGFQNGDATFARYDLGRTIIDARLIKAQFDPDGPETRAARNELDKTLRSFEAIEGRPPGMADIDRVAGEIVSNTARSSAPSWNQPAPQQQATDATLTANAQDTLYGAAGTDDLQGAQAGGQNDGATKPRIDPSYDPALAQLPKDVKSDKPWTIELRYHPIFHRGHAFWVLVDPDGNDKAEMHGLARSRNTGEIADVGMDGADLVVQSRPEGEPYFEWGATRIGIVASGNYDDIVVGKWNTGQKAAITINKGNFDYKAHDPAFEIGGNGGQIQNSNSVAFTLGHAMGVDLESTSRSTGNGRRFPGGDRNLLDPGYKRYVVPPMFGGVPHAP